MWRQGARTSRGLWVCRDTPTSGLIPEQDHKPRQANLVGAQVGEPQAGEGGLGQVTS